MTPSRPQYLCFFYRGRTGLGWLAGREGKKIIVHTASGEVFQLPTDACAYLWPGEPTAPVEQGKPEKQGMEADEKDRGEAALAQLKLHEAEAAAMQKLVARLWSARNSEDQGASGSEGAPQPPSEALPFAALAAEVLDSGDTPWRRGLLFHALLSDPLHIQYQPSPTPSFRFRGPEEAGQRRAQEAESRRQTNWRERIEQWGAALEQGEWTPGDAQEDQRFLEQLHSILIHEKQSPHWPLLGKALGLNTLAPPDLGVRLKTWLTTAGAWPGWPRIWLERSEVQQTFDQDLLALAETLTETAPEDQGRIDFREIPTYTFDSAGTRDFDDAFSILESTPAELTVAVHIAEPSSFLQPGHPLFETASRRLATAYNLCGIFPLFPERLSNGRFSLLQHQEREVVSQVFRISEGRAELLRIERGLVRVRENLDYGRAQGLLDEQPGSWGRLAALCAGLREARAERGAWLQNRRELVLDISNPAQIGIAHITRSGPPHQIVEELAILANGTAGNTLAAAGCPAIYRVQIEDGGEAADPLRHQFPPAIFTTQPGPHGGLGCPAYIQLTSPIRRFCDLVMQRQLIAHAQGEQIPFQDTAQLTAWGVAADIRLNAYNQAARMIRNHYTLRYLRQARDGDWTGTLRRRLSSGSVLIWLDDLEIMAHGEVPRHLEPGAKVQVRVETVDVDRQALWIRLLD